MTARTVRASGTRSPLMSEGEVTDAYQIRNRSVVK